MATQKPENTGISDQKSESGIKVSNFEKILVAVDYLDSTPAIFSQALILARKFNSHLMIFHCLKGQMQGMSDILQATTMGTYSGVHSQQMLELEEQLLQETTEQLVTWLRSFAQEATNQGVAADFDYRMGEAGIEICELAKNWGADLVIVGRRGRLGIQEIVLGSVSNYVLHHAPCSVLVMQHS